MNSNPPPQTSYLLWYHSNSHHKDRFFIGVTNVMLPTGVYKKPAWSYSKDECYIFDTLAEALAAKAYCEASKYKDLKIEPIDNKPIWTPSELVLVEKPKDAAPVQLKSLETPA